MQTSGGKPRVVFFQFKYPRTATAFQIIHRDEHVKCLRQFFDLAVVNVDCDYQRVCDEIEPELAIFETGLEINNVKRLKIDNLRCNEMIPRVALLNSDGCSELRSAILSDVHHWRIETLFTISLTAREHLKGVTNDLYVWPNFIDAEVFYDYSLVKTIPVLVTGSLSPRYPWRNAATNQLLGQVPTLCYPHGGYVSKASGSDSLCGANYSRLINSARVTVTCGSVTNELVRKHLEIPGSMCCLVTERSPSLEAAGFTDMVNCVMASPSELLEKLLGVLNDEERLKEITRRGYELVHSRHTMNQRSQIVDWFMLYRERKVHQRVIQADPFGTFELRDWERAGPLERSVPKGVHLLECDAGDEEFLCGNYAAAESAYRRCLDFLCEFPEAKVKIARCRLRVGDSRGALSWIIQPLRTSLVRYGAEDPDPVEWALFVFTLVCQGRVWQARRRAVQYPELRHLELDRVRWLVDQLSMDDDSSGACPEHSVPARISIHRVPDQDSASWIEEHLSLLRKCGQDHLTSRVQVRASAQGGGREVRVVAPRRLLTWSSRSASAALDRLVSSALSVLGGKVLSGLDHPEIGQAIARRLFRGPQVLHRMRALAEMCKSLKGAVRSDMRSKQS